MTSIKSRSAATKHAIAVVRDCAGALDAQAAHLLQAMPSAATTADARRAVLDACATIKDVSGRMYFEISLLQSQLHDGSANADEAVRRLTGLDASAMTAVAPLADVVERLESAAEQDAAQEPVFVLVIEAMGVMLQAIDRAKKATQALT